MPSLTVLRTKSFTSLIFGSRIKIFLFLKLKFFFQLNECMVCKEPPCSNSADTTGWSRVTEFNVIILYSKCKLLTFALLKPRIPLGRTSSSDLAGRMQMSVWPRRACLSPLNWLSLKEREVLGCEFTEGSEGR